MEKLTKCIDDIKSVRASLNTIIDNLDAMFDDPNSNRLLRRLLELTKDEVHGILNKMDNTSDTLHYVAEDVRTNTDQHEVQYLRTRLAAVTNLLLNDGVVKFTKQEIDYITTGQKINAIKSVRDRTGLGLKEAKDLVDAAVLRLEKGLEVPIQPSPNKVGLTELVGNMLNSKKESPSTQRPTGGQEPVWGAGE